MARGQYVFTFTLDKEENELIEKAGRDNHVKPTSAVRGLFRERLRMERAEWKFGDDRMETLIEIVARLSESAYSCYRTSGTSPLLADGPRPIRKMVTGRERHRKR